MITAALSFWDADPEEIARLLSDMIPSLSGLIDRVAAEDGSYTGFPEGTPSSGEDVHDHLRKLCADAGLDLDLHVPTELWPGQVAKRQALMSRAIEGSDWVCATDTDYVFLGDKSGVRDFLGNLDPIFDVVTVPFYTPELEQPAKASCDWHLSTAGTTIEQPFFLRALPGFRYEFRHWSYSALKDGKRVSLWGCSEWFPMAMQAKAPEGFAVEHRKFDRSIDNVEARRQFYAARERVIEETGVEP